MKHEIDHYVCVYGIQIIHVQYIKETSEIHSEFDGLKKSSQIHVQQHIHVHVH